MPQEARSRITLLLPVPTTADRFVLLNDIITHVVRFCRGATVSQQSPPIFDGWWMPKDDESPPDYDSIVLVQGDTLARAGSQALLDYLDNLKRKTQHIFKQDIVWITVHEITRVTTGDGVR